MPNDAQAIKDLFLAALDKSSLAERAAFLDAACASDPELRQRVEALLKAAESGSFPDFLGIASGDQHRAQLDATLSRAETPDDPTATSAEVIHPREHELPFLSPPREAAHLGRVDHYEVHAVVGQGGMGVVLKAFDESLDRVVAIKVLGSQYATNGNARRRFIREAKAVAAVAHEHVVTVHGVDESVPYIVMQFVKGLSLQERIDQRGPLEVKEILRIGMQMASGLAAAHAQGIVHRDIKPANILLENGIERVKITDFGLARAVDDASVTQSGVIAGTPMYMSPEQAAGEAVDPRSDLFSLGSVLYAMCTGHPPFRASGTLAVMKRVIEDAPRPIREVNAEIPDWLEAIVLKLLAKKPGERFQSAKELAQLLEQHLAYLQQPGKAPMPAPVTPPSPATPKRKRRVAVFAFAALLGALLGAYLIIPARDGELWIETDDANLIVTVDGRVVPLTPMTGVKLPGEDNGWVRGMVQIPLRPGKHQLRALRDGEPVYLKQFSLASGESMYVLIDPPGRPAQSGAVDKWTRLFNGKDLTGWKPHPEQPGNWRVDKDGNLVGSGPSPVSHLFSERDDFEDFHLRVEARINFRDVKGGAHFGNSGVYFRTPYDLKRWGGYPTGYEAQIFAGDKSPSGTAERNKTGSLFGLKRYEQVIPGADAGQWFNMDIIARGNRLTIKVNDVTTVDAFEDNTFRRGHLALQQADPGTIIEFRKIEIMEFPPQDTQPDREKLQGSWDVVSGQFQGKLVPVAQLKAVESVTFVGDRFTSIYLGKSHAGTYRLDPAKELRELDFVTEPDNRVTKCVYRMEGDRLTIALAEPGKPRPTTFVSGLTDDFVVVTYQRAAPASKEVRPFELTPPKLLQHMAGSWSLDLIRKTDMAKSETKATTGKTRIEMVAGGACSITRNRTDDGILDDLGIMWFDREPKEFRGMYFNSAGLVLGPGFSRFDSASRTLTGAQQHEGAATLTTTRFPDPDNMNWDLIVRLRNDKVFVDWHAVMKRLPKEIKIDENYIAESVPKEMEVLNRLVGEWDVEIDQRNPSAAKNRASMSVRKILGGRFIEVRERVLPDGQENYTLYTYDPQAKEYRVWFWSSRWATGSGSGAWDETRKTLTSRIEAKDERNELVWKFISDDHIDYTMTGRDLDGKEQVNIFGSHRRKAAPK